MNPGADHLRKLHGIYVDYDDGSIELPTAIGVEEARRLIGDVQISIDFVIPAWGDIDVAARMRLLDEHTTKLADMLTHVIDVFNADPDGTFTVIMNRIQSAIRDDPEHDG